MTTGQEMMEEIYGYDIWVERLHPSGGYLVSAIVQGAGVCNKYMEQQKYFFYSRAEAIQKFREYCEAKGIIILDDES
jgi:hypothetical protein